MSFESETNLFRFVEQEESHIDFNHLSMVNETSVHCGDPLINSEAEWRLVGGVIYLYLNDLLKPYITKREGKKGILEAHLACGWMFTKGYQTYQKQSGLIVAAREQVMDLNKQFGSEFVVPQPDHLGSAAPFMIGSY